MGRSYIPTYRIEYRDNTMHPMAGSHIIAYDFKRDGKPTDDKAEAIRKKINSSFAPGGTNYDLSKLHGVLIHVQRLHIVRQSSGETVAKSTAPMFEVV
jgi:hypothetical protein